MNGFLKNIQRKGPKAGSLAREALIRSTSRTDIATPDPSIGSSKGSETLIATTDEDLGDAEKLLEELKAESKQIVKNSEKAHGFDPSATRHLTKIASRQVVKMIKGEAAQRKSQAEMAGQALPYWLTDPEARSPQVDLLVPAAREALNELLTGETPRSELALVIRKAVNVAAMRLASEIRVSARDIEEAVDDLIGLMTGKGPLQPLYDDAGVTDIYLDGYSSIKCIRRGQALETPFKFRSPDEYESYLAAMLQSVDRVLNLSSPIVDCVLPDPWRSRVNAVHSSLLDGRQSAAVIRVPRLQQITFFDLLQTKTLPASIAAWLTELVAMGEANILVIGPTGSGKTVFTTALLSAVGSDERICTIEDVPEIFVPTSHLEKLVSRPENSQGQGAIGMEQLLRAALRRAPHRIVVGEIRDKEGPLFLKALETGHAGSVATIHASAPRDGLWRLLDIVSAYEQAPQESLQRRISRSVNILISMKKIDGRPCMTEISEVRTPINGEFVVQDLIKYRGEFSGNRIWQLSTGHSEWIDRLAERGAILTPGPNLLAIDPKEISRRE